MTSGRIWTAAFLCALAGVVATAPAAARPATAQATRATDATGDSGAAPDIRHVDVGTDVVKGSVVLWIETPNRSQLAGEDLLEVYIDADRNPETGANGSGIDYVVAGDASGAGALYAWDGADFSQTAAPSLAWTARSTWVRLAVHPSDLGGSTDFAFFVVASNGDAVDYSPDDGARTYAHAAGPLRLSAAGFAVSPKLPRAGRPFAAALVVGRGDTGELLAAGKITCVATIGGKRVPARKAWGDEAALCRVSPPRKAKGKRLRLTVRVTFAGKTVAKTYRGRIRM